jgi:hypothetical protein
VVKRVEQAIDAYENSLLTVFDNHKSSNETTKKMTDVVIPKELTAFLLRDLYQQKKKKTLSNTNAKSADLVQSLQDHVRTACLNAASDYSHASLKQKVRESVDTLYHY